MRLISQSIHAHLSVTYINPTEIYYFPKLDTVTFTTITRIQRIPSKHNYKQSRPRKYNKHSPVTLHLLAPILRTPAREYLRKSARESRNTRERLSSLFSWQPFRSVRAPGRSARLRPSVCLSLDFRLRAKSHYGDERRVALAKLLETRASSGRGVITHYGGRNEMLQRDRVYV